MNWVEVITKTIDYIEANILEDFNINDLSKEVYVSSLYLQKGFSIMCGYSISEYIRNRRLSLAALDLINTDDKVIDIAIKYLYDSPDSFTKAFTRFHGSTPLAVRKDGATIKDFAPLRISIDLKGGYIMEFRIEEKESFKVVGLAKKFKYDNAYEEVPKLWQEFNMSGNKDICPMYGLNYDETMECDEFTYMICDNYKDGMDVPNGYVVKEIPKFTWAIFPCYGPSFKSMPELNEKIFKEWLPNSNEYEIAAGYNLEMYSDPTEYENGIMNEKYYTEVWIPVKKKEL
ncbi:MAG: AraC family transcriptional regulator [Bacilli bacterium]|nr:AraC family transcriptional regulator [Bacilli bacterium]